MQDRTSRSGAAWIFDLDETLVSSAAIWQGAIGAAARRLGGELTPSLWNACKGRNTLGIAELLCDRLGGPEPARVGRELRGELLERWANDPLVPKQGASGLLDRIRRTTPRAISTGSPAEAIAIVLSRLGWTDRFDALVSSEEVERGKPFPDVFLEAARRLDAPPCRCIAVEDSPAGARAAVAAGMVCVVVPSVPARAFGGLRVTLHRTLDEIDPAALERALAPARARPGRA